VFAGRYGKFRFSGTRPAAAAGMTSSMISTITSCGTGPRGK
jgi:hypothetical protein